MSTSIGLGPAGGPVEQILRSAQRTAGQCVAGQPKPDLHGPIAAAGLGQLVCRRGVGVLGAEAQQQLGGPPAESLPLGR